MQPAIGRSRRARFVASAAIALLAAACAGTTPPPATTLAPTVELTPVPGGADIEPMGSTAPLVEAWHGKTLQDAVDALGSVKSYQFTANSQVGRLSGVVVNEDPPRYSVETAAGLGGLAGPPVKAVFIGQDQYVAYGSGPWTRETGDATGIADHNPLQSALPMGFSGISGDPTESGFPLPAFVDAGIEDHDGVQARHIRAIGNGKPPAGPNDPSFMGGEAFQGTVDAWIAVDGGYLVALKVKGKWVEQDPVPTPSMPFNFPFDFNDATTDVAIGHVDDAANVVEAPEVPPATPRPSGDAKVIAMIGGLKDALKALPAYRYDVSGGTAGLDTTMSLVIASGPPRRLDMKMDTGSIGFKSELIVIGNEGWERTSDGAWEDVATADLGGCFTGMPIDQCGSFSSMGEQAITGAPETFERLPERETIDGIETIHLRSSAGIDMGGQSLPGVSDLWVAADGGWMVRERFTSEFINMLTDIRPLTDSEVKVERPVP